MTHGGLKRISVTQQSSLGSRISQGYAAPLRRTYPFQNSYVQPLNTTGNPSANRVYPKGNNQATDPRAQSAGYLNVSSPSGSLFNGASLTGGSVINNYSSNGSGMSPMWLALFGTAVLLFIWR
jgi:hypothetical protein